MVPVDLSTGPLEAGLAAAHLGSIRALLEAGDTLTVRGDGLPADDPVLTALDGDQ